MDRTAEFRQLVAERAATGDQAASSGRPSAAAQARRRSPAGDRLRPLCGTSPRVAAPASPAHRSSAPPRPSPLPRAARRPCSAPRPLERPGGRSRRPRCDSGPTCPRCGTLSRASGGAAPWEHRSLGRHRPGLGGAGGLGLRFRAPMAIAPLLMKARGRPPWGRFPKPTRGPRSGDPNSSREINFNSSLGPNHRGAERQMALSLSPRPPPLQQVL